MGNSFSFKVFNQQDQTWMGAECLSADTTVSYDTDGHSNIVLPSGTYQVTYDPANRLITVTGGGTWTVQG
jgi:YD repeat-containing protein